MKSVKVIETKISYATVLEFNKCLFKLPIYINQKCRHKILIIWSWWTLGEKRRKPPYPSQAVPTAMIVRRSISSSDQDPLTCQMWWTPRSPTTSNPPTNGNWRRQRKCCITNTRGIAIQPNRKLLTSSVCSNSRRKHEIADWLTIDRQLTLGQAIFLNRSVRSISTSWADSSAFPAIGNMS